jgi:hypothetical protein
MPIERYDQPLNLLDLGQLFMMGYNASSQRAAQQQAAERQQRQDDRQDKLETRRLDMLSAEQGRAATAQEADVLASAERQANNMQLALAHAPEQARPLIEEQLYALHQKFPQLRRVEVPGPAPTDATMARVGAEAEANAYALNGPPKPPPEPEDEISKAVTNLTGLRRTDPGFREAYSRLYQQDRNDRLNRAKAAGGKDLPVSAVQDIADAGTAGAVLDDLLASFKKNAASGGVVQSAKTRIMAEVPNTDVSNYAKEAGVGAQVVGSFLEGGKLAESDYDRYKSFLPQPGDSIETAEKKVANVKRMIERRAASRSQSLGGAGYKVPGQAQQKNKPTGPTRTDPETGETRVWDGTAWVPL